MVNLKEIEEEPKTNDAGEGTSGNSRGEDKVENGKLEERKFVKKVNLSKLAQELSQEDKKDEEDKPVFINKKKRRPMRSRKDSSDEEDQEQELR
jgi:hypothetical protein